MPAMSLDRVLTCPTLPTLPAVALQVLELARDPNVTVAKLARIVQGDPSLSAKVLRTVNSSLFGLPAPCSKIDRALALLGLNTIKSLVLGFTLVESTRGVPGDTGLDLTRHWRRAVYAAAAARHFAVASKTCDPDEAFTAAMLQDIGMLASIVAIPDEYAPIIEKAQADHESLPEAERAGLGHDHTGIGAALARKWRLPEDLISAIEHHHAPDGAPERHRPLAQTVWLSMLVAESLGADSTGPNRARLLAIASQRLRCTTEALGPILERIIEGAEALAKAFDRDVGGRPSIKMILAQASEQLLETQMSAQLEASNLAKENQALARRASTDALTGASNRMAFDVEGPAGFAEAKSKGAGFAVLFVDADHFKSVNDTLGHPAGDAVLVELAARIGANLPASARAYRYGGEEFVVLAPGCSPREAAELAERLRSVVERDPVSLAKLPGGLAPRPITISVGLATLAGDSTFTELVKLADQGVYQAKKLGRNQVACVQHAQPAASPVVRGILLIEDDPFSARLVQVAIQKATGLTVTLASHLEEAYKQLGGPLSFKLIICDLNLGRESGLSVLTRLGSASGSTPVHILTSDDDLETREKCLKAGAARFYSKQEVSSDLPKWCRELARTLSDAA